MELLSEEEQWERLKAWLRTNGPSVLMLTALLLLAWFGMKWWKEHRQDKLLKAGSMYEVIASNLDAGLYDQAFAQAEALRREFPDSPYVAAVDLAAAAVHVTSNELDKAVERLRRVADTAKDEKLRPIARLRLARVLSAQGKYDEALATLGTAHMGLHEAARLEVRGDVLLASGDRAAALAEYQAARRALPDVELEEGGVGELLDLKIADLGGVPGAESPAPDTATGAAPAAEGTP